jgi:phosphate transport system protein
MSRLIDVGLEQLAQTIVRMGELAHKAVAVSLHGYIEGASTLQEVRDLSGTLEVIANEAEDRIFELIARYQPVATDLRILKSYLKIAYDFARHGRYALDVSQIYERLDGAQECEKWINESITQMSDKVLSMVRTSLDSLKSHNTELAKTLAETEKQVDQMYFKYLDKLTEKGPATNRCTVSSVLVVRYLERIADHATYTGESVVYIATGEKVVLR